jgi:Domain of unknown function (DUF4845)
MMIKSQRSPAARGRSASIGRQRGLSLFGLLVWAIVIGFLGYVTVRTLPTVNEFMTIKSVIDKIASENPPTVGEVRSAFEKRKQVEYSISSISGKDLDVTKENDKLVISFAYDKEIELVEPVYLLIRYKGRSK